NLALGICYESARSWGAAILLMSLASPVLAELPDDFPMHAAPQSEPGLAIEPRRLPRVYKVTYEPSLGGTRYEVHLDFSDFPEPPLPVLAISFSLPCYLSDDELKEIVVQVSDAIDKQVEDHQNGDLID